MAKLAVKVGEGSIVVVHDGVVHEYSEVPRCISEKVAYVTALLTRVYNDGVEAGTRRT